MSKGEDTKLLKIQTCVLKVNIHCDGCQSKVKKLLHKIEGVYTTSIDPEQGKVTVSGTVDPATIIKKLNKAGKHAEPWPTKGGGNPNILTQQLQKLHLEHAKGQQKENGKPQKGGKEQKVQQQPQQQTKGLKFPNLSDLKFPFKKDQKAVKFNLPPEDAGDDGSDYDDDYFDDFDENDFDDMDGFDDDDDDFYNNPKMMKPMLAQPHGHGMPNDKKGGGGGNGKKGSEVPVLNKGGNSGNNGGGKKGGGGGGGGGSGGGGGKAQDAKNGVGNNNKGGNGNGGSSANNGGGKKGGGGGGKNDGGGGVGKIMGQPNMMGQGFQGMNMGQMGGHMPPPAMGHMGNIPAVQGLPAGSVPPPGYFQGGGMPPPDMMAAAAAAAAASGNPYQQQQYLQAMLQQQQQQRMMMMMNGQDRGPFPGAPPMGNYGYGRPPAYIPPPQSHGEPFNMFSDENPNSCSVM